MEGKSAENVSLNWDKLLIHLETDALVPTVKPTIKATVIIPLYFHLSAQSIHCLLATNVSLKIF